MQDSSVIELSQKILPTDLVLDVGGWACPFNRADWVLDAEPYETRGFYKNVGMPGFQGPSEESFSKLTWVQRDICDKEPWPFKDKQFDWAICSHVLEDIRDPLFVCSELSRVAKRGYVEVPSRLWESCRGIEGKKIAGLSHHRWLIEKCPGGELMFLMKYHGIHSHWRYSFPRTFLKTLDTSLQFVIVWWENEIKAQELTIHGLDKQLTHLANYVQAKRPYSSLSLAMGGILEKSERLAEKVIGKSKRIFGFE